MIRFSYLTLFCLLALSVQVPLAQKTLPKVSVDIDPGSAVFTGETGLPFDVPFNIRGPIGDNLKKVTLTYKVNTYKKWMSADDRKEHTATSWKNIGIPGKDNKFTIQVGALYPNTSYAFNFKFYSSPVMDATKKKELYSSLFNAVDTYIKGKNNTSPATLNLELNTRIKQAIGSNLVDTNGNVYLMDAMDKEIGPVTARLMDTNDKITTDNKNINASITHFQRPGYGPFLANLRALSIADAASLSTTAKTRWKEPVTKDLPEYKTITMAALAKLWVAPANDITSILDGTGKIDGDMIVASKTFHEPSAKLLAAFLDVVYKRKFKLASDNSNYFVHDETTVFDILTQVNGIIDFQADLAALNTDRTAQMNNFPDVVASRYVMTSFEVQDRSNPDVTAQDNAYIGLDFGFANSYAYGNQMYLYEGVNFYLVPVNKNAPLSTIHGLLRQAAKRFSIHLGLTQSVMGTPNKLYEPLINNVGSIMIGAGFRINRFVHLNWGEMLFFEKDVNPLIDHKRLSFRPTASITFDLVSMQAIGSFLTKLGIK